MDRRRGPGCGAAESGPRMGHGLDPTARRMVECRNGIRSASCRSLAMTADAGVIGQPDAAADGAVGSPTPDGRSRRPPPVYAALDLGTNNCRLLVARPQGPGFHVIDAFSRIVRLGEGVARTGRLTPAAVDRTIEALAVCADKMRRRGANRHRLVATEACRRAVNCEAFLDRVVCETGLALEIITTHEEALLALAGCAPLLDPGRPYALVFDIGGGSTELTWVLQDRTGAPRLIGVISLPVGVVNLSERYGGALVTPALYAAMVDEVAAMLAPFEAAHAIAPRVADGAVQMLGTSGTVTTIAGVKMGLPRYNRRRVDGTRLRFDDIDEISADLAAMSNDDRVSEPCIGRERADLVVAGCAILAAICRCWPVGTLRVADRGVREGILLSLIAADGARRRGGRRPRHRRHGEAVCHVARPEP
ncbi:MAG: Ppx/GppA family phosphatase [Alphaproteobacteria bacterium]|nr:Ppx/GppA family phosphatase [Alphaproteobacteria bacterium]